MTDEEYIEMCAEKAREEARDVLKNYIRPYQMAIDGFFPRNMTRKEFKALRKIMESPPM